MDQRTYGYEERECAHNIKWVHLRIAVQEGDSGYGDTVSTRQPAASYVENVWQQGKKENKFQFSLKILHIKFVTLN